MFFNRCLQPCHYIVCFHQYFMSGVHNTHLHQINNDDTYEDNLDSSQTHTVVSKCSISALLTQFKDYHCKSNIIDTQRLAHSDRLKIKKYKESTYYGEIVNGKRHGQGIMLYASKRVYEGEWQSDMKHGRGYQECPNGCVYCGYYVNNRPEGVGRYQWPNGEFYQGEWLAGLRHGSGMWNGAKGDSYVGEWKLGKSDGIGVHMWVNGDRYQGQFHQNLKQGQGVEKFINGDLYKGSFYKGKFHGYGEYFWADDSFYKGTFQFGCREGSGIWKRSAGNSDRYQGEYLKDKKQGFGIFTWEIGNIYKGHYFQDQREGYGEMHWVDGSYYKGQWKAGFHEGEGTLFIPQQGLKRGIFHQNAMVQVYDELEPLIIQPIYKKSRAKSKQQSSKTHRLLPIPASTIDKKYQSLQTKRGKIAIRVKDVHGYKKISRSEHKQVRQTKKVQLKGVSYRYPKGPQFQKNYLTSIKEVRQIQQHKRQYIPHSAIYMHRINRRSNNNIISAKKPRSLSRQLIKQNALVAQKDNVQNQYVIL